ncbi:MAG: Na/Pi cotransporter family protein [Clostridiales bacterium]|nr:Na/Pi cotransporter family protein [Clostridiales bacterium]
MGVVLSLFMLIGGVGVFMTGMKTMGDGLEHGAGKGIQRLLGKISNNRFAGFGIGAAVTGIIQSSSATTVMVIGFTNAGIMTLIQAASIIFGANVGTTVTGLISALSAFPVTGYFASLAFVGIFIIMFSKKEKIILAGKILSGLGFIFIGLDLMGGAFKNYAALNQAVRSVFASVEFPLILVMFGMVFTGIIQSSSAVIGIIISMIGAEVLPLDRALFIVLGANIGTCVTALIAAVGTNVNAKRASAIHLLFNIVGTIVFVALLWIFTDGIISFLERTVSEPKFQVAVFHLIFNLATALIVLPFTERLVKFVEKIIPEKAPKRKDGFRLAYIDDRLLSTPPAAIYQLKNEVKGMADLAKKNLVRGVNSVLKRDTSEKEIVFSDEEKINFINKGIAAFLIKLSSVSTAKSEEVYIGSLHHVISDIERIGDYAQNFIEETDEIIGKRVVFSQSAIDEIKAMYKKVIVMYDMAVDILLTGDTKKFGIVSGVEDEVDEMKKTFGNNHIKRLNEGSCSVDSGAYFYAVISGLERVADHLTNIAFSIKSPSGSEREAMAAVARERG